MRLGIIALALAASACAASTTTTLAPTDAATALIVGEQLTMTVDPPVSGASGQDPLVVMRLRHGDGREMGFEEANHAPEHVMAQAPGGPLAQAMGLFGEERPTLYNARGAGRPGAAFLCPPDGPVAVGVHAGEGGAVDIVGLKQAFQFDARADGGYNAAPFSPDMVCARLKLQQR